MSTPPSTRPDGARFGVSLAQYSLHRMIGGGGSFWVRQARRVKRCMLERPMDLLQPPLDPIEFPRFAREKFDIGAVEYVSSFYAGRAEDAAYFRELKRRADGAGVRSLLIMVDREGMIGSPDKEARKQAAANHHKWIDAAAGLGCHSIRAIASSDPSLSPSEQQDLVADGLSMLADYGAKQGVNIIVENKDGLSCDADWLSALMRKLDNPWIGTLPDFGNFKISETRTYDAVKGIPLLMPFAKGVSVKAFDFDGEGMESTLPFKELFNSVVASGYGGFLGIEYEGTRLTETTGIAATKRLLERLIAEHEPSLPATA